MEEGPKEVIQPHMDQPCGLEGVIVTLQFCRRKWRLLSFNEEKKRMDHQQGRRQSRQLTLEWCRTLRGSPKATAARAG